MKTCATESITGRQLILLRLAEPDELSDTLELPSSHFTCLVLWQTPALTPDDRFLTKLIAQGVSAIEFWGPGCEQVEVNMDILLCEPPQRECHVITVSDAEEPIAEALWSFLFCLSPDEDLWDSTRTALAIVVGQGSWSDPVESALSDPAAFSQQVLADKDGAG